MIKLTTRIGTLEGMIMIERVYRDNKPTGQVMETDEGYLAIPRAAYIAGSSMSQHSRTFPSLCKTMVWAAATRMEHDGENRIGLFEKFEQVTGIHDDTPGNIREMIQSEKKRHKDRFERMTRSELLEYVRSEVRNGKKT